MQVKILGTRGEIRIMAKNHLRHSGILIDKKILIDVGEEQFLNSKPSVVLITHLHADHAFFISKKERIHWNIPVFGPEPCAKLGSLQVLSNDLVVDKYRIIPIPVVHSAKVKSFGYIIQKGNKRLFYSGDIVEVERQHLSKLRDLDAVITEASFIRKGGIVRKNAGGEKFGHAGIPDLVEFFKNFTRRIIFTHFGTWFVKNTVAGARKIERLQETGLKLEIACDGKGFRI